MKRFLSAVVLLIPIWLHAQDRISDADRLFAQRDDPEKLRQSIQLLEAGLATDPRNYELLWRLAKFDYYWADRQKDKKTRAAILQSGIDAARKAIAAKGSLPEGHFWFAANLGELSEMKGIWKSITSLKTIRSEFETAFRIDKNYEQGSVYQALGELNLRLPGILGGNDQEGTRLLEEGVRTAPKNMELKLTLAERYRKMKKEKESRKLLDDILSMEDPARTLLEQAELKKKARLLLEAP